MAHLPTPLVNDTSSHEITTGIAAGPAKDLPPRAIDPTIRGDILMADNRPEKPQDDTTDLAKDAEQAAASEATKVIETVPAPEQDSIKSVNIDKPANSESTAEQDSTMGNDITKVANSDNTTDQDSTMSDNISKSTVDSTIQDTVDASPAGEAARAATKMTPEVGSNSNDTEMSNTEQVAPENDSSPPPDEEMPIPPASNPFEEDSSLLGDLDGLEDTELPGDMAAEDRAGILSSLDAHVDDATAPGDAPVEADDDDDFDVEAFLQAQLRSVPGAAANAPTSQSTGANAWMNEFAFEEEDDEQLLAEYKEARRVYNQKKRAKTNTEEDDIMILKLEKEELSRQRAKEATIQAEMLVDMEEAGHDQDDGLFLPEEEETLTSARGDNTSKTKGKGKGRKRKLADVVISDSEADDEEVVEVQSKKKKGKSASRQKIFSVKEPKFKESGSKKTTKKNSKPKKPTKKQIADERNADIYTNLSNLTRPNIFRDIETNTGASALPNITTSTNKRQALKELLASIPLEHRDEGLLDNKAVFKAAAQFTPATSCRPDGTNGWAVKGMVSSLTHYQMLGTSFMRRQEKQQEDPRGGIVADAMGLGKTVMMIANIVNGKNLARGKGPTLVVAPAGLVHQWQGEILRHAEKNRLGKVTRYVTGHRGGQEDKEEYLKGFAIIVTTYSEICSSYPRADPPLEITDSLMKEQWWQGHYEKHKGPFHRIQFHRIILDEAQAIKNHKSITSIACRAVEATHRWAISGTPVQNTLSEFYPYFKFLHMDNTGSYKSFRANFCTEDDPAGGQRLAAMLRKVMLRRTHADMLMGVKLLELPATENTDMLVHMSEIERGIYDVVHKRFVKRINVISKNGTLKKNYNNIFVMLLRLRQLVAHPLLIQDTIKDLLEKEDFIELEKVINAPQNVSQDTAALIQHLRRMLRTPRDLVTLDALGDVTNELDLDPVEIVDSRELEDSDVMTLDQVEYRAATAATAAAASITTSKKFSTAKKTSRSESNSDLIDLTNDTDHIDVQDDKADKKKGKYDDSYTGATFGMRNNYGEFLTDIKEAAELEEQEVPVECCYCQKSPPKDRHDASCGHPYCNKCLQEVGEACRDKGLRMTECWTCKEYITGTRKNAINKTSTFTQAGAAVLDGEERKKKANPGAVVDAWIDADGNMLPSAKTLAFKAQVLNWLQNEPDVKIVVYSQFLTMIRILSKICALEGWDSLQYTGTQSIDRRDKVLRQFAATPSCRILLASLRAGGTGLNLTCASRVLLVDLWWNASVEQQAFARTYRRGQEKETRMTRLITADSVDTDLVQMQERKEEEIQGVLNAPEARKKMSMQELLGLFGTVNQDEDGRTFVIVDDGTKGRAERVGEEEDDDGGRFGGRNWARKR